MTESRSAQRRRAEALRDEAERLGTGSVNVSNTTARLIAGDLLEALAIARTLAEYLHEPPDECEHGFSPPDDCPNEECEDRDARRAWFAAMSGSRESDQKQAGSEDR